MRENVHEKPLFTDDYDELSKRKLLRREVAFQMFFDFITASLSMNKQK